jgi:hypothetical protein
MKKRLFSTLIALFSINILLAQIVVFTPVKVNKEDVDQFLNVEMNYSKKIAQDAVNNGNLLGWALLQSTNPGPDDYNYMWVNAYPDINTAANKNMWWNNSEKVVGIKPDVLFSDGSKYKFDRSYTYQMKLTIPNVAPAGYVLLNFTSPDDVDAVAASAEKYVLPHFKKNMGDHGMVGWGMATKITPQGKDYSSVMFYDSYDTLANAMRHLAGESVMKGLPFDKMEKAVWEKRPLMKVIAATEEKQ